jgi:ABC-type branched-subunit amino acid transport system substrate-binding protein
LSTYPDSDRANPARLRLAQIEYAREDKVAARRLLATLDLRRLDLTEQRAALRLRVALSQTPVERLENLSILRATLVEALEKRDLDPATRTRLLARIQVVDRELSELIARAAPAELEEMMRGLRGRPPAPEIALELGRRALDEGQLDLAERRLNGAEALVRSDLDQSQLRALKARLLKLLEVADADAALPPLRDLVGRPRPRTDRARGTLGVVLPLSGDFAHFGEESLRGILLAAGLFSENEAPVQGDEQGTSATPSGYSDVGSQETGLRGPAAQRGRGVRLIVRDSEGDPEKAAAAVRELSEDSDLVAIIGPVFSAESTAAADAAEEVGIPVVTLSNRQEVPEGRAQAFRTRTTPADEVGALVSHAFEGLSAERFAVLYPRTRYGRGMRKLYWEAVTERGGKMVAASSYDPEAVDFGSAIRDMIGYRFLTHWEKKALSERDAILRSARRLEPEDAALLRKAAYEILGPEREPLPPIVDFDVLFIPDSADKITMIAPGLAFHEIRGVGLLGSSEWAVDGLLRVGRQHISGAVISTPFYPESDVPFVVEFVEGYRNTFAAEPDAYAAEAFDATNLLLVQLSAGRTNRRSVRDGLLDTRAFPGATGVLTMHPDGNARRRPFLLRVSGRRFQPLD